MIIFSPHSSNVPSGLFILINLIVVDAVKVNALKQCNEKRKKRASGEKKAKIEIKNTKPLQSAWCTKAVVKLRRVIY